MLKRIKELFEKIFKKDKILAIEEKKEEAILNDSTEKIVESTTNQNTEKSVNSEESAFEYFVRQFRSADNYDRFKSKIKEKKS